MARGDYYQGIDPRKNPFSSATLSARPVQRDQGFGGLGLGGQAQPSGGGFAEFASSRGYNPMLDPTGGFAGSTKLGSFLSGFYQGPTRGELHAEYAQSIEEDRKRQVGEARGKAFQMLADMVNNQGMNVQQAVLKFVNTPEGVEFIARDPDPETAMTQFLKLAQGDPTQQIRQEVMGGASANPAMTAGDPWNGMRQTGQQPALTGGSTGQPVELPTELPEGSPLDPPRQTMEVPQAATAQHFRDVAVQFMARSQRFHQQGLLEDARADQEKARIALELAGQYDKLDNPEDLVIVPDKDSPSGARFVTKSEAADMPAFPPRPLISNPDMELTKYHIKRLEKEIDEPASAARSLQPNIQAFKAGLRSGKFDTGAAGGFRKTMSQYAQLLGLPTDTPAMRWLGLGDPASAELMEGSANMIAESMAGSMSRVTNMSLDLLIKAGPELMKTKGGNELLIKLMETNAERALEIQQFKEDFIAKADSRGEEPNFAQMYKEIETMRQSWAPIDTDFATEIDKWEKAGKGVSFNNLIKLDEFFTKKTQEETQQGAPNFKSVEDAQSSYKNMKPGNYRVIINGRPATIRITPDGN